MIARVDAQSILQALAENTMVLGRVDLQPDAPPAFLLDADRRWGDPPPLAGQFDNRSVSFPTDFPSASALRNAGIQRVLVVQNRAARPQEDLSHTLRLWQEGGLILEVFDFERQQVEPLTIGRPSIWGWIVFRARLLLRLRRNPLGGYGGYLAPASSG